MYLACTPFFPPPPPPPPATGVMCPRRIPKANYGLVTTVGATFYAITRLRFTAGALTHLPGLMCDVYRFNYADTHLFDNVVTRSLPTTLFFRREKHGLVNDVVAHCCKGEGRRREKITANECTNSCFSCRTRAACIIPQA